MIQKRYLYWREQIHLIAARKPERRQLGHDEHGPYDAEIEKVMDCLYNEPGFRLARRQVGQLVKFARKEWGRLRPESGPPIRVRYFFYPMSSVYPTHEGNLVKETLLAFNPVDVQRRFNESENMNVIQMI